MGNNFIKASFADGLLYKPSDINTLFESNIDEDYKLVRVKFIVERLNLDDSMVLNETFDSLNAYYKHVETSNIPPEKKKYILNEISNLVLGIVKFVAPWLVKLLGWLTEKLVSTKTFGQGASAISGAIKKITPDAIKKGLDSVKDVYKNVEDGFQRIQKTVQDKVNAAFKGTNEKPPVVDIAKAHANLVSHIEKWPLVGKIVGVGKKLGISPEGFYKFIAIALLSVLAMFGSQGAAIILILYGATVAAQRLVKAGKEAGTKVAAAASQSMDAAQGKEPQKAPAEDDIFASLDAEISGFSTQQSSSEEKLSPELEGVSSKWSEMLKKYIDGNNKDQGIEKIKTATQELIKSGELTKPQAKSLMNSILNKIKASDDIKKALMGALADVGVVSVSESYEFEESFFSYYLMKSMQPHFLTEEEGNVDLDQIATQWATLIKKMVDSGKESEVPTKLKKAIDNLAKEELLTKEELKPFLNLLSTKSSVSEDTKKQILAISSESDTPTDSNMPTSTLGAAKKIQELASQVKTPEEAQKKAEESIKKNGLKGKLAAYEEKVYAWIGKIPLIGKWFSKRSKTQQRIIVLIAIVVLSYLAYKGVKWAIDAMGEQPQQSSAPSGTTGAGNTGGPLSSGVSSEIYATKSQVFSSQLIDANARHGDIGRIIAQMAKQQFSPEQIADTLSRAGIHGEAATQALSQASVDYADFAAGDVISKAVDFVDK